MANVDPQLVRRWIKQQIIFDQATISYRALARECSCPADQARELIEQFLESEDGRRLKVKPTYLVFGRDEQVVGDCCCSMRVERADEDELEDVKARLDSVSTVQIYSIRATQAPDPNLLKSQREVIQLKPTAKPISKTDSKEGVKVSKADSKADSLKPSSSKKVDSAPVRPLSPRPKTTSLPRSASTASAAKPSSISFSGTKKKPSSSISTSSKKEEDGVEGPKRAAKEQVVGKTGSGGGKTKRKSVRGECGDDDEIELVGSQTTTSAPPPKPTDALPATPRIRKRVTKTRKVEKKKIIRVKDKKGYRVNREVVEEVSETYTDWEDDEEVAHREPVKKKSRKDSQKMTAEEGAAVAETVEEKVPSVETKKEAKGTEKVKKKPPASTAAKEQSNITSFFKKG